MEFGKPELIERKVIQSGIGTMKDHIEDFVFNLISDRSRPLQ
jgi:hypothetical protein